MSKLLGIICFGLCCWITLSQAHYEISCRFRGVFHVQKEVRYNLTSEEAKRTCLEVDAAIATKDLVEDAREAGFEICRYGWVDNNTVVIPRITPNPICAANYVGVFVLQANVTARYDVFCYNASDSSEKNCEQYIYRNTSVQSHDPTEEEGVDNDSGSSTVSPTHAGLDPSSNSLEPGIILEEVTADSGMSTEQEHSGDHTTPTEDGEVKGPHFVDGEKRQNSTTNADDVISDDERHIHQEDGSTPATDPSSNWNSGPKTAIDNDSGSSTVSPAHPELDVSFTSTKPPPGDEDMADNQMSTVQEHSGDHTAPTEDEEGKSPHFVDGKKEQNNATNENDLISVDKANESHTHREYSNAPTTDPSSIDNDSGSSTVSPVHTGLGLSSTSVEPGVLLDADTADHELSTEQEHSEDHATPAEDGEVKSPHFVDGVKGQNNTTNEDDLNSVDIEDERHIHREDGNASPTDPSSNLNSGPETGIDNDSRSSTVSPANPGLGLSSTSLEPEILSEEDTTDHDMSTEQESSGDHATPAEDGDVKSPHFVDGVKGQNNTTNEDDLISVYKADETHSHREDGNAPTTDPSSNGNPGSETGIDNDSRSSTVSPANPGLGLSSTSLEPEILSEEDTTDHDISTERENSGDHATPTGYGEVKSPHFVDGVKGQNSTTNEDDLISVDKADETHSHQENGNAPTTDPSSNGNPGPETENYTPEPDTGDDKNADVTDSKSSASDGSNGSTRQKRKAAIPEWLIVCVSLVCLGLIFSVCIALNARKICGQKKKLIINGNKGSPEHGVIMEQNGDTVKSQEMVQLVSKDQATDFDQTEPLTQDEIHHEKDMKI